MNKTVIVIAAVAALLGLASAARAADFGTAEEARALLIRAIGEVRLNRDAAIAKFNKGEAKFVDRDLYVFCFDGNDGKILANADKSLLGRNVRDIRDITGYALGDVLFRDAKQGVIKTFNYMWPRPGDTKPLAKVSYASRIGGVACGVGYYK